ncbi:MAG: hypothetical protein PVSMB1_06310 [Gemmatimonadaceae bacterium]
MKAGRTPVAEALQLPCRTVLDDVRVMDAAARALPRRRRIDAMTVGTLIRRPQAELAVRPRILRPQHPLAALRAGGGPDDQVCIRHRHLLSGYGHWGHPFATT